MLILKLIDKVPFFAEFSQEDKELLAESGSFFEIYEKGALIIQEDTKEDALFVIIKGSATVFKNIDPKRTLATLQQGAVFGEISFLTHRPRSTNVKAQEKTICFLVNGNTMKEMSLSVQLQLKDQLIDILIKRLDAMNSILPSMLG